MCAARGMRVCVCVCVCVCDVCACICASCVVRARGAVSAMRARRYIWMCARVHVCKHIVAVFDGLVPLVDGLALRVRSRAHCRSSNCM